MSHANRPDGRPLRIATWSAAAWALLYGLYRLYYALGGTVGMLGTPVSHRQWLTINAIASALLFAAAALPLVLAWKSASGRFARFALCWIIAVACISHATIGIVQRISSLTGILTIPYPFWETIDRRLADVQALFFNEPWFLGEGILWGVLAWAGGLRESPARRAWLWSAGVAITLFTVIGLLSAFGVIGTVIVG